MKGSRVRYLIPLVIIAVWVIILANAGRADTVSDSWPVWPEFHADMMHIGRNPNSSDLENPASLDIIWVFPRPDADYASELESAVDDTESNPKTGYSHFHTDKGIWDECTAEDAWSYKYVLDDEDDEYSDNSVEYGYHSMSAVPSNYTSITSKTWKIDTASWTFPYGGEESTMKLGYYYIYVWVPTAPDDENFSFTTKAVYTVYDDTGSTQITFDQSDGGGWQLLSDSQFSFKDETKTSYYGVELTNVTDQTYNEMLTDSDNSDSSDDDDDDDDDTQSSVEIRVAADAVKFVRGTGMEIYSSPVSATVEYCMTHDSSKADEYETQQEDYNGQSPVVYIGTVEKPLVSDDDAPDTGAVYCVNSVTPINGTLDDNPQYEELSERLGTAIWRYPSRVLEPDEEQPSWEPEPDAAYKYKRKNPIEGPVEGGFYSTPTLAHATINGATTLVCYMTGCDRQVYALDAETGELLWKGPGMTVGERADTGWNEITSRDDAFGGSIRYSTNSTAVTRWTFDSSKLAMSRSSQGDGWSYSVYAWIPPVGYGETSARGKGKYVISYNGSDTATVIINQSSTSNQGKWVQLGSSYFNVKEVSLQPVTSGRTVVSDAVMIVPDTIGTFSYCSPVANISKSLNEYDVTGTDTTNMIADTIFAVTATGRVISFSADGLQQDNLSEVKWVYPKIRTKAEITEPSDADADPLGSIGATPTYWFKNSIGHLFVAALDGHIYCLNTSDGSEVWTYFDQAESDSFGDEVTVGGFTSTPTIDDSTSQLFIGSVTGYFYSINATDGSLIWRYPDNDTEPLGAFRYSTTVVGDASDGKTVNGSAELHRAWIGSTDGTVYSFNAQKTGVDLDNRRLYVSYPTSSTRKIHGGVDYTEFSISPIQGSVAFDAAPASKDPTYYTRSSDKASVGVENTMTMYAGDMEGRLYWLSANSGRSDWRFDSSNPNATQADLSPGGNEKNRKGKNYQYFQTMGELFSSPNVTPFKYGTTSNPISYVYVGCSDGRVYAFSDYGGAWGGSWAGGYWPFPEDSMKSEGLESDPEVQCEIFKNDFYQNSVNNEPNPKGTKPSTDPDGNPTTLYYTPYSSDTNAWYHYNTSGNEWIVSPDMKMITNVPTSTGTAFDMDVDNLLKDAAKEQRKFYFGGSARTNDTPIYFEWGETINIILWNLPARKNLKGRGSSAFKLSMANASGGSSAGSITTSTRFKVKEYNVLYGSTGDDFAPLLRDSNGKTVRRTYAYLALKINYKRSNNNDPPSPGPGWTLKISVTSRDGTTSSSSYTTKTYPIARLISGNPPTPFVADEVYQEQDIGVNNPLAIMDDQGETYDDNSWITGKTSSTNVSIAWPNSSSTTTDFRATSVTAWGSYGKSRNDPEAHYNGNAKLDTTTDLTTGTTTNTYSNSILPTVDLWAVNHGTTSRQARLWVMDRSATGTNQSKSGNWYKLGRFRISADELGWNGGETAIKYSGGVKFPWEFSIGSADYPNISKQHQSYQKASDGADPSNGSTELPRVYESGESSIKPPLEYDDCILRPDAVYVSIDVPRFQPANIYGAGKSNSGYSKRMKTYIDSDGDGKWDSGNVTIGKPATYQEAYRRFSCGVRVPPDPKIEVEQQTIDIGRTPHGLGLGLTDAQAFSPYNPNPDVSQWFKEVTIKNAGNVNIPDMYIGRQVRLYSDQAGSISPVPYNCITSSLDWSADSPFQDFKESPFTTSITSLDINSASANSNAYCYTLTKSKVGDPDPSIMTIPDKRKWDMNFYDKSTTRYTKDYTEGVLTNLNSAFGTSLDTDEPLPVKVSVEVPLTQPIGAYRSYDLAYGLPYVPVFADLDGDGVLDLKSEPVAETSFQLNLSVRENQLTGGVTKLTLPQIDIPDSGTNLTPRVGDSTPAAFRDPASGSIYLFWSSNRMLASSSEYPTSANDSNSTDFANAPWFIDRATLNWDSGKWEQADENRWWSVPTAGSSNSILPPTGKQWPTDVSTPMRWTLGGSDTDFYSVRHHSPSIANRLTSDSVTGYTPSSSSSGSANSTWPTWLAWAGDADVENSDNKVTQDHLIFYTNVTGGDVTSEDATINYIKHDPITIKRSPSMAIYGDRAWMFWQGENDGKLSLMYSTNDTSKFSIDGWADDNVLAVSGCLSSVSAPNCIFRRFWGDLNTSPDYSGCKELLDVIYAGTSKYTQNSDILLSRYIAANQNDINNQTDATIKEALSNALPSKVARSMPRVFNEKLRRDPKYGFYASQHLSWIKPDMTSLVADSWGRDEYTASSTDVPYIHVLLPEGYTLPDGTTISSEYIVSATDGSIRSVNDGDDWNDGTEVVAASAPSITYDEATGIYTYEYASAETTAILGKMLIDFSGGVVRFTQPLNEVKDGDSFIAPEVRADYTPLTWRLTTDDAVDNSPRAFIERTDMNSTTNPGLCKFDGTSAPVDRLWVFWRKAGTGVKTSTIYYKTYRVGIDLAALGYDPIPMVTQRSVSGASVGHVNPSADLAIDNARGPWEVNRAGTKIYFSEVDERYQSLNGALFDNPPADIKIKYTPSSSSGTGSQVTVTAKDIYWIEETPEQSLLGFSADGNVNEDSIYAFADPGYPNSSGTFVAPTSSKIWVFWTSTRGGTSDLFWETVSPSFAAD